MIIVEAKCSECGAPVKMGFHVSVQKRLKLDEEFNYTSIQLFTKNRCKCGAPLGYIGTEEDDRHHGGFDVWK